jgi:hypothetical protein
MRAHGFTDVKAFARSGLGCEALTPKGSHLVGGPGRFEAIGDLNVKPLKLPHNVVRTDGILVVVSNPDTAAQCARQMLATDHAQSYSKSLTSDMIEAPNTGGPGSLPLEQGGVVTDGSYEIIGSQGRIIFLGGATNRPEADQVEQDLRVAARSFG